MSGLLGVLLLVWGVSFVVLAVALALVVLVQGARRHLRALVARATAARPAEMPVTGDRTQLV